MYVYIYIYIPTGPIVCPGPYSWLNVQITVTYWTCLYQGAIAKVSKCTNAWKGPKRQYKPQI